MSIFELLLAHGANKKLKAKNGDNALQMAKENVALSKYNAVAPVMITALKK